MVTIWFPLERKQRDIVFRAIADPTRRRDSRPAPRTPANGRRNFRNFSMSRPADLKASSPAALRGPRRLAHRQGTHKPLQPECQDPCDAVDDWLRDYEIFWAANPAKPQILCGEHSMNPITASDTIVQEITIRGCRGTNLSRRSPIPEERLKWWGGPRADSAHKLRIGSASRRQVDHAC